MTTFLVFHEGGSYESYFYVNEVEAPNPMQAAQKVHKHEHSDTGDYEYYVVPKDQVVRIKATEPKTSVFEAVTHLPDTTVVVIKTSTAKKKGSKKHP